MTSVPSLVDSLQAYIDDLPAEQRVDALHQVFYGFYTRVAVIDRATQQLAAQAQEDVKALDDLPAPLAEALRDNALFVGQELFASRVRTMAAMGYVSSRLAEAVAEAGPPPRPFTLTQAVAFDQEAGRMRLYDLGYPDRHPDLPYDALAYDPGAG
jgi:hypothetical protein